MANDVAMEQRELAEMQPENVEEVETESVPESDIKNATNASEVVDNQSVTTSNFGETMNVLALSPVEVTLLRKSFDLLLASLGKRAGVQRQWLQWLDISDIRRYFMMISVAWINGSKWINIRMNRENMRKHEKTLNKLLESSLRSHFFTLFISDSYLFISFHCCSV